MLRCAAMVLIFLPAVLHGQTEFGIKGGLNISDIVMTNYINPDVEADLKLKLGLHAGVFVSGTVNEKIGMAAELLYSDKGVKGFSNIHLHYITLPLIIQYQLAENIYAELGPEPGYLFSSRSELGDVSGTYNNKFDLALDGGFRFNTSKLIFGIRYCVGIFSVREPIETMGASGIEKIKYQNRVLQFSVGYKLWTLE
ncbi:MAG: porin family protein [Cyclobacteriaceae bacterium]